jgi:hypothetical protein
VNGTRQRSGTTKTVITVVAVVVVVAGVLQAAHRSAPRTGETSHGRTVVYGASWSPSGVVDETRYGPIGRGNRAARVSSPWHTSDVAVAGQRVSLLVNARFGPDDLTCWIQAGGTRYTSENPRHGHRTARTCFVEGVVS